MLIEQTLDKLNTMKLGAMADACQQQIQTAEAAALGFEERFGLLVDAEWTAREQRKLQRRLRAAKLRHPATLEAVDFTHARRLNRQQVLTLGACAWIAERHNLLLIGPTGIGKSFLSCAFVERACRRGFTARYVRMPRLLHELAVGRGDGSYARLLTRLAKLDLLAIDDWMIAPLRDAERRDLTEVIEDRAERASTLIASQLPVTDLARRHRRPQPGRRHLRPPAPRRTPHRAEGPLDAADTPRPEDPHDGGDVNIPTPVPAPRPNPASRTTSPAGAGRPMDRTGGMENAHDALAADCTVSQRVSHTALDSTERRPYAPQARSLYSSNKDVTTNVAPLRRAFHFAGIRVPDPRNPCSTSPKCAPGVEPDAQPARRGQRRVTRRVDVLADVARANPFTPPAGGRLSAWR